MKAIRHYYPHGLIGYWCNERVKDVLQTNPRIDTIFSLSRGDLKKIFQHSTSEGISRTFGLWSALRKAHFDVAFDFSLDHRYALVAMLAGIRRRIGYDYRGRGRFLTDRILLEGYAQRHVVEYYADLLQFVKLKPLNLAMELFVTDAEDQRALGLLTHLGARKNVMRVGIVPGAGASWGKEAALKHWPAIKFKHLADMVMRELKADVVLLGDEGERPLADSIVGMMQQKPIDLVGKTDVKELAAVIKNLDVLVTNDGGPLHMAVALGIKTVSLFGPVDEQAYGPFPASPLHRVAHAAVSCRPCYKQFRMPLCERDRECLKSINEQDVFILLKDLLG